MRRLSQALCLSVAAFAFNAQAADSGQVDAQARKLWYQNIETGYQHLNNRALGFAKRAEQWCADPASESRADVEQAWQQAFMAWQAVRFVDFGPVEAENRAWQFQFWPDPKNLIARKARHLLSADQAPAPSTIEDAGAWSAESR